MAARIIDQEQRMVRLADLRPFPGNPREGDIGAIGESIRQVGFYGGLLVQKSTGYIIAGNHRAIAAEQAGLTEVPAWIVDVDDETARRMLIGDNRTNDLASHDENALAAMLQDLALTPDGLAGTGFDGDDLDALLERMQAPNLGDLESRFGADDERRMWPFIRVQVSPEVHKRWSEAMDAAKSVMPDDSDAVAWLLDRIAP